MHAPHFCNSRPATGIFDISNLFFSSSLLILLQSSKAGLSSWPCPHPHPSLGPESNGCLFPPAHVNSGPDWSTKSWRFFPGSKDSQSVWFWTFLSFLSTYCPSSASEALTCHYYRRKHMQHQSAVCNLQSARFCSPPLVHCQSWDRCLPARALSLLLFFLPSYSLRICVLGFLDRHSSTATHLSILLST